MIRQKVAGNTAGTKPGKTGARHAQRITPGPHLETPTWPNVYPMIMTELDKYPLVVVDIRKGGGVGIITDQVS